MSFLPILGFFISLSIFFAILKLIGYSVEYKVVYGLFRTKKGLEFIDKLSKGKIVKYLDKISYYSGFLLMFVSVFLVLYGIIKLTSTFSPLIPGTEVHGIYIPFLPTIIAIFFAAFFHEIFHGILARYHNISLKSWGFFFLGPFLGAFVEPDEEEIKKIDERKQISIYNAGPLANIMLALLSILTLLFLTPIYSKTFVLTNVTITKVENNSPAALAGVIPNSTIIYIDNIKITSISDIYKILKNKHPGDTINISTTKGNYLITLGNKNGRAYIGIFLKQNYIIKNNTLFNLLGFLLDLLNWMFIVNLGIAIANMLPIYPLDGGRSLYALLRRKYKNKAKEYTTIISLTVLFMLIVNILISYI